LGVHVEVDCSRSIGTRAHIYAFMHLVP
jgi:hypothetical protein